MKKLLVALALAGCASAADAATVTFTLDLLKLGAGNFELRAATSAGDNGGLAAYSVSLTNVATVNHNSLRNGAAQNSDGSLEGPVGFTLLRTADDADAATVGPAAIYGSQDTITPTPFVIYGMGQTAGDLASRGITTFGSKEGDPWAADMVVAVGTYTPGVFPAFDQQAAVPTLANVFNVAGATATSAATVQMVVTGLDGSSSVMWGGGPSSTPPDLTPNIDPLPPISPPPSVSRPAFDPFASAPPSDADIPVSVALTRRTRPVASHEIASGAPDGYVHEFFVTSATDVIGIHDVALDVPVYQNRFGMDYRAPSAKGLSLFPGLSADSFLHTPGQTEVLGGYANPLGNPETVWYDRKNSGAQDEFLFARLTVGETGSFSATMVVAGPNGAVHLPFNFVLPATAEDLALLDQEAPFAFEFSLDTAGGSASASQIPEPSSALLLGIALITAAAATSWKRNQAAG